MTVEKLEGIVGKGRVVTDRERMIDYLTDETAIEVRPLPAHDLILVKPASTSEVCRILKFANEAGIPVFPRGGGTGLCGGAVPTENGIILSLERMNKINVDNNNLMVSAEAGATLNQLLEKVEQAGLFFPPHPGDQGAHVGGLVACNAGGARAVKYGIMRSYVKGIDVVLPTGEPLSLGGKLIKNNTGYDLMHLIIGSEGTLAVITRVVLRLFARPGATATMIIPYDNRHHAVDTVPRILQSGITPLAIEYLERSVIELAAAHLGSEWPCRAGTAHLMLIVEGRNREEVHAHCARIVELATEYHALEAIIGETRKEQETVLKIRSNIYTAMKRRVADVLDIAVPPADTGKLMDAIDSIAERFGTTIPICVHVGDGNVHPHLMKDLIEDTGQRLKAIKVEIYQATVKLGGTLTGEHGVGKIRTPDLNIFKNSVELELMRAIKAVFDPNGILNPDCAI